MSKDLENAEEERRIALPDPKVRHSASIPAKLTVAYTLVFMKQSVRDSRFVNRVLVSPDVLSHS